MDHENTINNGSFQRVSELEAEIINLKSHLNKANMDLMQGAGVQTSELVVSNNVEIVLTGHYGPKAFQTLKAAGIKIVTGVEGKVKDVVEKFKQDQYKFTDSPDVQSHWG